MAARAGDREAFATLVERDGPGALRMASAILRSEADAQDAVQDAFVRAWRDLPTLRQPQRWPAWFRALTVHASIDIQRRRLRLREVDLDASAEPSEADALGGAADRDRIRRAMSQMSVDDRAVLVLRYVEDLEVPAIAATLGVRLGTAKSRLHRATMRLRASLGDPAETTP